MFVGLFEDSTSIPPTAKSAENPAVLAYARARDTNHFEPHVYVSW